MIAHKMTLELPATRSLRVRHTLEFAPGPVEVIILGREEKAPGVVTDAEGMSVEEFRKQRPAKSRGLVKLRGLTAITPYPGLPTLG
jgi:hypothetical protein